MMNILEITAAKALSSRFEPILKSSVRKHESVETEVLLTNLAQQTVQIVLIVFLYQFILFIPKFQHFLSLL